MWANIIQIKTSSWCHTLQRFIYVRGTATKNRLCLRWIWCSCFQLGEKTCPLRYRWKRFQHGSRRYFISLTGSNSFTRTKAFSCKEIKSTSWMLLLHGWKLLCNYTSLLAHKHHWLSPNPAVFLLKHLQDPLISFIPLSHCSTPIEQPLLVLHSFPFHPQRHPPLPSSRGSL